MMIMTIRMVHSSRAFLRAPRMVAPRAAEIKLDTRSGQSPMPPSPAPSPTANPHYSVYNDSVYYIQVSCKQVSNRPGSLIGKLRIDANKNSGGIIANVYFLCVHAIVC